MRKQRDVNSLDERGLGTKSENTDQKYRYYVANGYTPLEGNAKFNSFEEGTRMITLQMLVRQTSYLSNR